MDVNPWLSTLIQEVGNCKLPGTFYGEYSNPCIANSIDLSGFAEESYSVHLMKAITATVYALRGIAFNIVKNNPNVLFDPDTVEARYQKFLDIEIPNVLEGVTTHHQPFTDGGNGRVGYTIYNIDGDKSYAKVFITGHDYSDTLGTFDTIPEFYESGTPTPYFTSTSDACVATTVITTTTDGHTTGTPIGVLAGLIAMGLVLGLLIIIVPLVVYFSEYDVPLMVYLSKYRTIPCIVPASQSLYYRVLLVYLLKVEDNFSRHVCPILEMSLYY